MKNIIPSLTTTLLKLTITCCLVILSSCKDDVSLTGIGLMPENEHFNPEADDTTPLEAMVKSEIIRSDDAGIGLLGTFIDPKFGTTTADFLVQMLPKSFAADTIVLRTAHVDSLLFDGLFLNIPFPKYSWLGDSMAIHNVSVYEVIDPLSAAKYYSDLNVEGLYNPEKLASALLKAEDGKYYDTLKIEQKDGGEKDSLVLQWNSTETWKIKLPDELLQRVVTFYKDPNIKVADDYKKFQNIFRGVYITSSMQDNNHTSLIQTSITGTTPINLTLKFRQMKKGKAKDGSDSLIYTSHSAQIVPVLELKRINRFSHQFSENITFNDPSIKNLYIQGMGGAYASIKIDTTYLFSWKDSLFSSKNALSDTLKYGISNIGLSLEVDTLLAPYSVRKSNEPVNINEPLGNLYVWLKNKDGELTTNTYFKCGLNSGYVFESNRAWFYNSSTRGYERTPYAPLDYTLSEKKIYYGFRLNPYYFEALLAYKNNPKDTEFNSGGKYYGFLDDTGKPMYMFDLGELVIKPANPDYVINRSILKSPVHDTSPLKLTVKYFTFK
ncbi:MAG: DUF4270 family protein [Breznakibacter sp.]